MKPSNQLPLRILAATIGCVLASAVMAAGPLSVESNKAVIHAGDEAPAYNLRVSYPDGRVLERQIIAKETLAIDPVSPGGAFANGQYRFELTPIVGVSTRTDESEQLKTAVASVEAINGSFRVVNGSVLVPDKPAVGENGGQDYGVRLKDIIHPDDVIINGGSLCVGFDCVDGEVFGFDTIRLKENNLRLHFDDTSTGTFPDNDWTLVANDTANGGAEFFGIEDRSAGRMVLQVTAGAPANSLFVDSSGRVGLKTSTPVVELHMADGDSPTMRLEQNGSSGFTAQTWDVAGNEANFFVRDVTNGSTLPFRIQPGAATNSIFVDAQGDVGFGTNTVDPNTQVHVKSDGTNRSVMRLERNGNVGMVFQDTSATAVEWSFGTSATGNFNIALTGVGVLMQIDQSGNITCRVGSTINGVACTGL